MYGGNLPAAYRRLPLESCKGLRPNCLQIFIDSGYAWVKFSTMLEPAGGAIKPLTDVAVILETRLQIWF